MKGKTIWDYKSNLGQSVDPLCFEMLSLYQPVLPHNTMSLRICYVFERSGAEMSGDVVPLSVNRVFSVM